MDENRVNTSNEYYKFEDMIFTSKSVFDIIVCIDRNLRFLYAPNFICGALIRFHLSPESEDLKAFDAILDRVEKLLITYQNRLARDAKNKFKFKRRYPYKDLKHEAFNDNFSGIMTFLHEASNIDYYGKNHNKNHVRKRFLNVAKKLWELKIRPRRYYNFNNF